MVDIRQRQAPLRERYRSEPDSAIQRLEVHSLGADLADPLHCEVGPTRFPGVVWRSGAHAAVGGDGDVPCSGDLLLGALAACQEITLRMVAANMGVEIRELTVEVDADWDSRGTLAMGREFPVGIRSIRCHTQVGMNMKEPLVMTNLDRLPIAREGITCVVCHREPYKYGRVSGRFALTEADITEPINGPTGNKELKRVLSRPDVYSVTADRNQPGLQIHGDVRHFFHEHTDLQAIRLLLLAAGGIARRPRKYIKPIDESIVPLGARFGRINPA